MNTTANIHEGTGASAEKATLLSAALILAFSAAAEGGLGVVTLNQHPTFEPGAADCNWTATCTGAVDPPFDSVANTSLGASIDAFSYHVNPLDPSDLDHLDEGRFCQATCKYSYASRPKIVSDDMPCVPPEAIGTWLSKICATAETNPGRVHLEHYDWSIEENLAKGGSCVGGYNSWPQTSKTIINYFDNFDDPQADPPLVCPSILEPNGEVRHPSGLARLSWKGVWGSPPQFQERYITLAGFGFMGALSLGDRLDMDAFLRSLRSCTLPLCRSTSSVSPG